MSYELRAHTADVAVAAHGARLGETFAATAAGMTGAMCEEPPDTGLRRDLTVAAEGREALLFDYLDELIYERDVHGVLPVEHEATVSPPRSESDAGEPTTGANRAVSAAVDDSEHDDGPISSEHDDGPISSEHDDGPISSEHDDGPISSEHDDRPTGSEHHDRPTDPNDTGVERGERWTMSASYRGVPLAEVSAREVKAVTYSEMELERTDGGWRAYVVLDV